MMEVISCNNILIFGKVPANFINQRACAEYSCVFSLLCKLKVLKFVVKGPISVYFDSNGYHHRSLLSNVISAHLDTCDR